MYACKRFGELLNLKKRSAFNFKKIGIVHLHYIIFDDSSCFGNLEKKSIKLLYYVIESVKSLDRCVFIVHFLLECVNLT